MKPHIRTDHQVAGKFIFIIVLIITGSINYNIAFAQTPGMIFKTAGANATVLDPNNDGYTSSSSNGFVTNDQTESEIPYKALVVPSVEPVADPGPGPDCGFTDIVDSGAEDPVFTYYSGGNLLFRFRMGKSADNSKGYSIMIDTDQKFGFTGTNADPLPVAGNPGFEIEIVLRTNFGVSLYDVNGTTTPVHKVTLDYADYAQKSIALTDNCDDPDYFYDFFIPFSVITTHFPSISTSTPLRMLAVTTMNPAPAIGNNAVSDAGGIDDQAAGYNYDNIFQTVIDNYTPTSVTGTPLDRSKCPTITAPISNSATTIYGTSTEIGATIKVYKGTTTLTQIGSTTTVAADGTWNLTVPAVATGEIISATAQNTGEGESYSTCSQVTVTNCSSPIPPYNLVGESNRKYLSGTASPGGIIKVYLLLSGVYTVQTGSFTLDATGNGTFCWFPGSNSNSCTGTANALSNGTTYYVTQTLNGCESARSPLCIDNQVSTVPTITQTSLTTASTTLSGTSGSGASITVYANGTSIATTTASGTSWSATVNLSTHAGKYITVGAVDGTKCAAIPLTAAILVTSVPSTSATPVISGTYCGTTPASVATIYGTSTESDGAIITVYNNGVSAGTTTVYNSSWSKAVSVTGGDKLTATATGSGENVSALSNEVTVSSSGAAPTVTFDPLTEGNTTISGNFVGTGTLKIYIDGFLLGSSASNSFSITVGVYDVYAGGTITASLTSSGCESAKTTGFIVPCQLPSTSIAVDPETVTICSGSTTSVTLTGVTSGIIYQLFNGTSSTGSSRLGTSTSTLTLTSGSLTADVTLTIAALKISSVGCSTELDTTVAVTVLPVIADNTLTNPSTTTFCQNGDPDQIVGSAPSGGNNAYTYQWKSSTDNSTYTDIVGATSVNYNPGTLSQTTYFKRVVTSGPCESTTSTPVTITIQNTTLTNTVAAIGATSLTDSGTPSINGNNAGSGITYNWQSSADNSAFTNTGITTEDYNPGTTISTTTYFRRIATNGACAVISDVITYSVNHTPSVTNFTKNGTEDIDLTFTSADFTTNFTDSDSDALTRIRIESVSANGVLSVGGATLIAGSTVNAADFANLVFSPSSNFNGSTSFTWKGYDNAVYSGTASTVTINISAVNDAPTAANKTITTNEDVTYTFAASDFNGSYADTESSAFAGIKITGLETAGALKLNGSDVALNATVVPADLTLLTFVPAANANASPYATFTFQVYDGTAYSGDYTITVNVTAVNDAPTAANKTVTTNEDITYTFAASDFNGSYADTESSAFAGIKITGLETAGALKLNGSDVALNATVVPGDLTLLTFVPAANANASPYATFTFQVYDGTAYSGDYTITVNVTAVNDAPTAANKTVTTNEDVTYTFAASDFNGSYADTESSAFAGIKITGLETAGALKLNGADVALNATVVPADLTLLTFVPAANANASPYATFTFQVYDGAAYSGDYTITVNVTAVNDAPTAANKTVTTNEDITYTFAASDFNGSYADTESSAFAGIKITGLETAGSLKLNGSDVALNATVVPADLTLLTFVPAANANASPYATFTFQVYDGTAYSGDYTITVNVTAVNDAPTAANKTVTTNEDVTYTFTASDFNGSYADTESSAFAGIKITDLETAGSLKLNGSDVALNTTVVLADLTLLTFVPAANANASPYASFTFQVYDGTAYSGDYTITVNVTAVNDAPTAANKTVTTNEDVTYTFAASDFNGSYADTESSAFAGIKITGLETAGALKLNGADVALNATVVPADLTLLTFVPATNTNGSPYATFTFQVYDGTAYSSDYTITVNVTAVNDAPTAANKTVTTNEDVTYTFTALDFDGSYADTESSAFAGIKITGLETAGALKLNGSDVALNATVVPADLTLLTFVPAANANASPYATFTFQVYDGTAYSGDYTITVNVTAVNDAPTAANKTVTTNEDVTYTFAASDFNGSYADTESSAFAGIKITGLETAGALKLNGSDVALNATVVPGDLTLLTFVPAANANASPYATFTFQVYDGTAYSGDYTITVNVTAVNDAPTAANKTVTTNEDVTYTFAASDFNGSYADTESSAFAGIKITGLETAGSLKLNGSDVALNATVVPADLALLTFVPAANANASPYATFTFQVYDGTAYSGDYTITVNVTAVNDAPTAANKTVTTNEDVTYTFAASDFNGSYADTESSAFAGIKITGLETAGSLKLNGSDVALNTTVVPADLTLLTFVPAANANASPYATFTFQVYDGTAYSGDYTITVNVTAVNDAPTFTKGFNQSDLMNAGAVSVSGWATSISAGPADESSQTLTFTVTNDNNSLFAVQPDIDESTGNLTYTLAAGATGVANVSVTLTDNGGTANSGVNTTNDSFTVTVSTVANTPPTASGKTVSTSEDVPYTFSTSDFNGAYADAESDAFAGIKITSLETDGALKLNGADVALNATVPVADLSLLSFHPTTNENGSAYATFTFQVSDGTDFSGDYTITIDVTAVNDAPTAANKTVTTNEDVTYTFSGSDFNGSYADTESSAFAGIKITGLETAGALKLNGADVALNATVVPADLTLLTFVPATNANGTPYATFTFQVYDGTAYSSDYTITVNVTAVNDVPTAANKTVTTNEDVTYTFTALDFDGSYADTESSAFAGIKITGLETAGALKLNGSDVALNATVVPADLTLLTFVPATNTNGSPYATFTFQVYDGTAYSGDYTVTVNVTAVNDAPTAANKTVTTNEDVTYTFTASDFSGSYADTESSTFAGIKITGLATSETLKLNGTDVSLNDVISPADLTGITFAPTANANGSPYATFTFQVFDGLIYSGDYTITIDVTAVNDAPTFTKGANQSHLINVGAISASGWATNLSAGPANESSQTLTFSVSNDNNALFTVQPDVDESTGNLTYTVAAGATGTANVTVTLTDDGGTSNSGVNVSSESFVIIVSTVPNTAPIAADKTVITNEDVTYTFAATDFSGSYSDGESNAFAGIKITGLETSGTLQLNGTDVTLNSTVAPADLTSLTFAPAADANGTAYATFTFQVFDGFLYSGNYTITVNVVAVNDLPTAANKTISTNEDLTYTFAASDFNSAYSDAENTTFAGIKVTSLETAGSLKLNGSDVTLNSTIATADLTLLTYVPAENASGSPYATFTFQVYDGTDYSSDYTLTVNTLPVNDSPSFTKGSDQTHDVNAGAISVSSWASAISTGPSDEGSQSLTFTVTNDNNALFTIQPDIDEATGTLTYTLAAGINGTATVTVTLSDNGGTANGGLNTSTAQNFTITVNVNNTPPVASNDNPETNEDVDLEFNVTANDTDVNGSIDPTSVDLDPNTSGIQKILTTTEGTWSADDTGVITFTPSLNYNGNATISYTVNDDSGQTSNVGTITVSVLAVNDSPEFGNKEIAITINTPYTGTLLTSEDTDPDGTSLTINQTPVSGPSHGTIEINSDGSYTYTPDAGFTGTDVITVEICDAGLPLPALCITRTLTVSVTNPSGTPPVVTSATITLDENVTAGTTVHPVEASDHDPGDVLTFTITGGNSLGGFTIDPATGEISVADPSVFDFETNPVFVLTIQVTDLIGNTTTVEITVTLIDTNNEDTDNDGINDIVEKGSDPTDPADSDSDGIPDFKDVDSDNDGLADETEKGDSGTTPEDSDNDSIPDYVDTDSDNDGVEDSTESGGAIPTGDDTDGDGVDNAFDPDSGNTLIEEPQDTDGDSTPDFLDDDDDNDGISTETETTYADGVQDHDNDNIADYLDADDDNDTIATAEEDANGDGDFTNDDCDGDTTPDYLDADQCKLKIELGFSPNGDADNDTWKIRNIEEYPDNNVKVFNRWGNLIYEVKGYNNADKSWGGESNGRWIISNDVTVPDGTYFYAIDLGDGSKIIGGFVVLKR